MFTITTQDSALQALHRRAERDRAAYLTILIRGLVHRITDFIGHHTPHGGAASHG